MLGYKFWVNECYIIITSAQTATMFMSHPQYSISAKASVYPKFVSCQIAVYKRPGDQLVSHSLFPKPGTVRPLVAVITKAATNCRLTGSFETRRKWINYNHFASLIFVYKTNTPPTEGQIQKQYKSVFLQYFLLLATSLPFFE